MSVNDLTPVDSTRLFSTDISPPNPIDSNGTEAQKLQHQNNGHNSPTLNQMRWFQMTGMLAVIIIVPTVCTVAFCITRSPYCFTPCSILIPPVWRLSGRITAFLFPLDARDFQIEIAKVFKMHRGRPAP